jgi:hypothetical protein
MEGYMSSDSGKKIGAIAGATAVVFGSAFGVIVAADAKEAVMSKQDFREKLAAISAAVKRGEISPIANDGTGAWVESEQKDLRVADWLQTWTKATPPNWGKV